MRKIVQLTLISVIVLVFVGVAIACQSNPQSTLNEKAVRDYADPVTETTLQGLSENNLAKYIQNGNSEFKAAVTHEVFDKAVLQINSQLGAYESKEFSSIEKQEGYTIVHYKAKYSRGEVGIRMVFDEDHLVAGQWFE